MFSWMSRWVNMHSNFAFVYLIRKDVECYLVFLHIMHGSPCICALQNLNVKAWVTIVNL